MSGFEKMLADNQNAVPKRLSFDFLNNSPKAYSRKLKTHLLLILWYHCNCFRALKQEAKAVGVGISGHLDFKK